MLSERVEARLTPEVHERFFRYLLASGRLKDEVVDAALLAMDRVPRTGSRPQPRSASEWVALAVRVSHEAVARLERFVAESRRPRPEVVGVVVAGYLAAEARSGLVPRAP